MSILTKRLDTKPIVGVIGISVFITRKSKGILHKTLDSFSFVCRIETSETNRVIQMKSFFLPAIEYTTQAKACNKPVRFADRIMKEAMQSPAREAFNSMKKEYDWNREGSNKRFIR